MTVAVGLGSDGRSTVADNNVGGGWVVADWVSKLVFLVSSWKINWVTLNPHGEFPEHIGVNTGKKEATLSWREDVLPKFESFVLATSDVMEEDVMGNEPGLVFFEVSWTILSSILNYHDCNHLDCL
ncbi:hypothetical protein COLO4_10413 [Corchorus olitorius]|uniref:Uncharacterized protein n=1 Tax=Corchorus olitorius TaxID=93759 RepID=A0A1R3K8M8_9ROSI|nr:hypothetical protein COLO4_10413 [Corchorus olitorius]